MSQLFTNVGEFRRGKGNKKTRFGPRISELDVQHGKQQRQTPDNIAINKLTKALGSTGLDEKNRKIYIAMMKHADQLRFMDMTILAQVLLYLHHHNQIPVPIYQSISTYIDRLVPHRGERSNKEALNEEELAVIKLRMSATFVRYIYYVLSVQAQSRQQLEEANLEQSAIRPPISDIPQ
jgi:hypothetical protein